MSVRREVFCIAACLIAWAALVLGALGPGCSGAGASGNEYAVKFAGPDGATCYAIYSDYKPIGGNCK